MCKGEECLHAKGEVELFLYKRKPGIKMMRDKNARLKPFHTMYFNHILFSPTTPRHDLPTYLHTQYPLHSNNMQKRKNKFSPIRQNITKTKPKAHTKSGVCFQLTNHS